VSGIFINNFEFGLGTDYLFLTILETEIFLDTDGSIPEMENMNGALNITEAALATFVLMDKRAKPLNLYCAVIFLFLL
jgi:hypothetical protein